MSVSWKDYNSIETPGPNTTTSDAVTPGSYKNINNESTSLVYKQEETKDGYGDKTIGFWGGFCLLVNNITGPGMVTIPILFQQAGWLLPSLCMLLIMVVSNFSSTFICQAMAEIPGNERFGKRVEISTLAKKYFNKTGYYTTQFLLVTALQAMNIGAIIVSSQTVDLILLAIFDWTGALELYPNFGFTHTTSAGFSDSPFGPSVYVISLGFLISLLATIPLGYFNLDDNIIVQKGSFLLEMATVLIWFISFFQDGLKNNIPAIGKNQANVLGMVVFNYAFVTSVPSWVNEKKPHVNINNSVWYSNFLSTGIFIALGWIGASAFTFKDSADILDVIVTGSSGSLKTVAQITAYTFPGVVLSGVPVFSIIIRYNLMDVGLHKQFANFWGVLLPWIIAIPFYTGAGLVNVINWASLLFSAAINFIIPLLLFIASRKYNSESGDDFQHEESGEKPEEPFLAIPFLPRSSKIPENLAKIFVVLIAVLNIFVIVFSAYQDIEK